jgi:hypothetical protein
MAVGQHAQRDCRRGCSSDCANGVSDRRSTHTLVAVSRQPPQIVYPRPGRAHTFYADKTHYVGLEYCILQQMNHHWCSCPVQVELALFQIILTPYGVLRGVRIQVAYLSIGVSPGGSGDMLDPCSSCHYKLSQLDIRS